MCRQPRWWELPCGLSEHGLDPLHRLGGHAGGGGAALHHLVGRLQGGGKVHQPLDLDAVAGPMCEMWLKLEGADISLERRSGFLCGGVSQMERVI